MRRVRVEFRLAMPATGSWNGRWSGEGRNYTVVRRLPEPIVGHWTYRWDDGWCAGITSRLLRPGERKQGSDGFCGYEWMVDSIIRSGRIEPS